MINNLNYYNVFYMVAKTGSISRAANQLYISQPAVSKAISNLEESIGIALFVRNSRGVALTEEGTILYDYIERALDNIVKSEKIQRTWDWSYPYRCQHLSLQAYPFGLLEALHQR